MSISLSPSLTELPRTITPNETPELTQVAHRRPLTMTDGQTQLSAAQPPDQAVPLERAVPILLQMMSSMMQLLAALLSQLGLTSSRGGEAGTSALATSAGDAFGGAQGASPSSVANGDAKAAVSNNSAIPSNPPTTTLEKQKEQEKTGDSKSRTMTPLSHSSDKQPPASSTEQNGGIATMLQRAWSGVTTTIEQTVSETLNGELARFTEGATKKVLSTVKNVFSKKFAKKAIKTVINATRSFMPKFLKGLWKAS